MKSLISIRSVSTILLSLLAWFLVGCSLRTLATEVAPRKIERSCNQNNSEGIVIAVVNLGWHTGLLVPSKPALNYNFGALPEFANSSLVEIGWGDRDFYRASGYSIWLGLRALFFSGGSVLHVVGLSLPQAESHVARSETVLVELSAEGFGNLMNFFENALVLENNQTPKSLSQSLYGTGHFYRSNGDFSLDYTCNSWTAEALKNAGCPLQGRIRRASTLIDRLEGLGPADDNEDDKGEEASSHPAPISSGD